MTREKEIRPDYYKSGELECEEITKVCPFDLGNVIKYVFRAGVKDNAEKDLEKALQYIAFVRMGFEVPDLGKISKSELPDWKKRVIWDLATYAYTMDPGCLNESESMIRERLNDLKR